MEYSIRSDAVTQPESPAPCPLCGHRPTAFDPRLSALLDMTLLLEAVLGDIKHAIEELAS